MQNFRCKFFQTEQLYIERDSRPMTIFQRSALQLQSWAYRWSADFYSIVNVFQVMKATHKHMPRSSSTTCWRKLLQVQPCQCHFQNRFKGCGLPFVLVITVVHKPKMVSRNLYRLKQNQLQTIYANFMVKGSAQMVWANGQFTIW